VEYRPFREFATHQAFTVMAQLGAGLDIPMRVRVATDKGEISLPPEGSFGFVYVRLAFDWRRYF
ncbi:MAG TPA: hypothetical protein VGR00_08035, partial [Thermoanaerobaculia bacterium]|nr:hypothetical protein [Thermoanaerobaculia bacterium]